MTKKKIHKFRCTVVLNITAGFGNIVENKIDDADVPGMIEHESCGNAKVTKVYKIWDSGWFSHDLYIDYDIVVNCSKATKQATGDIVSGILNFTGLQPYAVKQTLRDSIEMGFKKELSSCGTNIVVILKSCYITTIS